MRDRYLTSLVLAAVIVLCVSSMDPLPSGAMASDVVVPHHNNCRPMNSKEDLEVPTTGGKHCFFPFFYNNVKYDDCVLQDPSTRDYFCPTNCRGEELEQCKWLKSHGRWTLIDGFQRSAYFFQCRIPIVPTSVILRWIMSWIRWTTKDVVSSPIFTSRNATMTA